MQSALDPAQQALAARRLPGMQPVQGGWITVDDAYAAQIATKRDLLQTRRAAVLAVLPRAQDACAEMLEVTAKDLSQLPGFTVNDDAVTCPDGRSVTRDSTDPLLTLAQLLQEDICILQKHGGSYVLTAALLCFPASWMLAEKIGKPLGPIHAPVPGFGAEMTARVTRLFDNLRTDQPLWRANLLAYEDPTLFQPRTEADPRPVGDGQSRYLRSERQTLLRLPDSDAVAFTIHTTVTRR